MKMKANEVRKMSAAELDAKLVELKKDLFNLRLQHATCLYNLVLNTECGLHLPMP